MKVLLNTLVCLVELCLWTLQAAIIIALFIGPFWFGI